MTSSPDPLGFSDENIAFGSSPIKRRSSSISPRKPLLDTSGNTAVQEFYISTPTPTKRRQSQAKEEPISPWRIRVTVQAEQKEDDGQQMQEHTIVTKVPLKGGDDSSPVAPKRGRGRPRKSMGSPVKRTGTPKPKANRRMIVNEPIEIETDSNILEADASSFAKRGDAFPKRRARRSSSPEKVKEQPTPSSQLALRGGDLSEAETKSKRSRSRKRRTEITPMKIARGFDDSSLDQELSSPSRKVQALANNPAVMSETLRLPDDEEALQDDEDAGVDTLARSLENSALDESEMAERSVSWRDDQAPQDSREDARELTPDPTDEHQDFDTILESEGFSMVSVESLASAGNYSRSPTEQTGGIRLEQLPLSRGTPSNRSLVQEQIVHGYSDISSSIVSAASPTKTDYLPVPPTTSHSSPNREKSVHGYSDISSSIVSAASPTKNPHLLVAQEAPSNNRVSQLRRTTPKKARPSISPFDATCASNVTGQGDDGSARAHGYSDISSMPLEEPPYITGTRQVHLRATPTNAPSPSMPGAPHVVSDFSSLRTLAEATDGTPKLERVVRAGSALQGLPSPREHAIRLNQRLGSPFHASLEPPSLLPTKKSASKSEAEAHTGSERSPSVSADRLFSGFNGGTRRELKAGLRLGEELAKRQMEDSSPPVKRLDFNENPFIVDRGAGYPKLETSNMKASSSPPKQNESHLEVSYPSLPHHQLPSPAESVVDDQEDRMSWKAKTTFNSQEPVLPMNPNSLTKDTSPISEASLVDQTMMAREAEWQRERAAVSKEIQMANTSQVIVIDSDDFAQNEASGEDIDAFEGFTSELRSPDLKQEAHPNDSDLFLQAAEVAKPHRSKLPSPWRRSNQIYSDDKSPERSESDLFWQPDRASAAAAQKRRERKMQKNVNLEESSDGDASGSVFAEEKITTKVPLKEASTLSEISEPGDPTQTPRARLTFVSPEAQESGLHEERKELLENDISNEIEETEEIETNSYRSDDVTQDNLKPRGSPLVDETSIASTIREKDSLDGWSTQRLTFIDPELLSTTNEAVHPTASVATQTSTTATTAREPSTANIDRTNSNSQPITPTAAKQQQNPRQQATRWFSALTSIFSPPPPPWYNSPSSNLPPATKSDILASSANQALAPTTPWTAAHAAALLPLYTSSWLFGPHIFAFDPSSPTARYSGKTLKTALGWERRISASDCGVVDAFMTLLASRSRRYNPAEKAHHFSPAEGEQYALPAGTAISEELVLRKCLDIWVDLVMCGDVSVPEGGDGSWGKVGLRRKGDRVWDAGSDLEGWRSQRGYYERKRMEWGGLPSWREKGLI